MLIDKTDVRLGELDARWQLPEHDLLYLIETGQLPMCIHVFTLPLELAEVAFAADGLRAGHVLEQRLCTGLVDLFAADAHCAAKVSGLPVRLFPAPEGQVCRIPEGTRVGSGDPGPIAGPPPGARPT